MIRVRASCLATAILVCSATARAVDDPLPPQRFQIAAGAELVGTTGQFNDVFIGPYIRPSYRLTPSISIGVVGAYGVLGTAEGGGAECSSGSQRHLWRATGEVRVHARTNDFVDVWAGIEAGIGVMHSIHTESCPAGWGGGPFDRKSSVDQVAPLVGPAFGVSFFAGRFISIDLAARGWVAFFPVDDRPGAEDLRTKIVLAVGIGPSVHFSP